MHASMRRAVVVGTVLGIPKIGPQPKIGPPFSVLGVRRNLC